MRRREALVPILEYHGEGMACSLERRNGTDGDGDECRGVEVSMEMGMGMSEGRRGDSETVMWN